MSLTVFCGELTLVSPDHRAQQLIDLLQRCGGLERTEELQSLAGSQQLYGKHCRTKAHVQLLPQTHTVFTGVFILSSMVCHLAPRAPLLSGLCEQPSHPSTHGPLSLHWWTGSRRRTGGTEPYSLTLQEQYLNKCKLQFRSQRTQPLKAEEGKAV